MIYVKYLSTCDLKIIYFFIGFILLIAKYNNIYSLVTTFKMDAINNCVIIKLVILQ